MKHNFIGSTIALILGVFIFLGRISKISSGETPQGSPFTWGVIIIGALSYRSLKKRKLGLLKSTKLRQFNEIMPLVGIGALIVFPDFWRRVATEPLPIVVLMWALIAYGILFFKKHSS